MKKHTIIIKEESYFTKYTIETVRDAHQIFNFLNDTEEDAIMLAKLDDAKHEVIRKRKLFDLNDDQLLGESPLLDISIDTGVAVRQLKEFELQILKNK